MQKKSKIKSLIICESRDEIDFLTELVSNFSNLQLVGACTSISIALELIIKFKPDLIICDLEIRKESIFNVFDFNKKYQPFVIFMADYYDINNIQKSLKCNVIDFCLKPLSEAHFIQSLLKLKSIFNRVLQSQQNINNNLQQKSIQHIFYLTEQNNYKSIPINRIVEINSNNLHGSIVTLNNNDKICINKKLLQFYNEIQQLGYFIRTSKTQIISKYYIDTIELLSNSFYITLTNQSIAVVNRSFRKEVLGNLQLISQRDIMLL